MSKEIELLTCPLDRTNLIEANAGTGKTYTITALTARMIIERSIPIEQILVVTFTKAAVSDLRAKIYGRLTELKDGFENGSSTDSFTQKYISAHPDEKETAIGRLNTAIRDFDMNSIFTIHGFCQRMLTENSFSGRIAYDTEMTGDMKELLLTPVRDFWRKYIYALPKDTAEIFVKDSPETFLKFLVHTQNNPSAKIINAPQISESGIADSLKNLKQAFAVIKSFSADDILSVFTLLFPAGGSPMNGNKYKEDSVRNVLTGLIEQINADDHTYTARTTANYMILLTKDYVASGVKKNFPTPEHPLFAAVQLWAEAYEAYAETAKDFRTAMLVRLKEYGDRVLDEYKLRVNSQSYSDLIIRMRNAVTEENSQMVKSLLRRYSAALIDEFQDTDPNQYEIFNESFGKRGKPFFMIGDPKQAIYSFRGADIYTYLKASIGRDAITLTENHRSDSGLVDTVNHIFSREASFLIDRVRYNPSTSKKSIKVSVGGETLKPMTMWQSADADKDQTAQAAAYEISRLLNHRAVINDGTERPVRPSDFAVLTRSGDQAKTVRDHLERYSIPCVITGSESVFKTLQAHEMARLIAAAASPYSERAVRSALASDIFGYDAKTLADMAETGEWERVFEDFLTLSDIFHSGGIAPMFFRAAKMTGLYRRLAETVYGERKLTNMIHLVELAQKQEAKTKASPSQLFTWFTDQIENSDPKSENYQLKMDSDENAVTITTIHKSKGLEYNIVFAPFLKFGHGGGGDDFPEYHDDDEELVIDLKKDETSAGKAAHEELAEDLRITYVALTRAKALCYTSWGSAKSGKSTALNYLINKGEEKPNPDNFKSFFSGCTLINTESQPVLEPIRYTPPSSGITRENRDFGGQIPSPWRINSFSALIHSTSSARDTEQFVPQTDEKTAGYDIFSFPKGAKAGSCLHECMENIPLESVSEELIKNVVTEKLEKYSFDQRFVPAVTQTLKNILTAELTDGICLNGISDYVHEMEFHIRSDVFRSDSLSRIIGEGGMEDFASACSVLDFTSGNGFLTGFADLIFCLNGKYYILDWKSNHLGGSADLYSTERMHDEMMKSHYYLQLYFYTLALHMHLKNTLPGYSYEQHMGGGIYVFMRGVESGGKNGVYAHRPPERIITEMEKAVTGR
ncbi:MAG: exodeoxyribonuclease V subunit beta [Deferribacterales bacterium]